MQCPPLIKLTWFAVLTLLFCTFIHCLVAQTSDAQPSESQSWTKTTESQQANMNPTRTTESHKKSANGTEDHQTVERLGAEGHYEPYYDTLRNVRIVTTENGPEVLRPASFDLLCGDADCASRQMQGLHPAHRLLNRS
jgi:hypothetical protein